MKPKRWNTYTAYSIGCGIVWAIIWIAVAIRANNHDPHNVFLVFVGWVIGWLSATIARTVYARPVSN